MQTKFLTLIALCFFTSLGYAQQRYFLCGPDEDGCPPDDYSTCLCMPYDGALASQPYCLDLTNVSCVPLALMPDCPAHDIIKGQGRCLATAFQSEPDPPCDLTDKTFCITHKIPLCEKDGGKDSCH